MVQWLRLCVPNTGHLGSIPGQRTRSYMLQLKKKRSCMAQLRPSTAKTKQPKKPHSAGSLRGGPGTEKVGSKYRLQPMGPVPSSLASCDWSCPFVPRTFAFLLGPTHHAPHLPPPIHPLPTPLLPLAPPSQAVSAETRKFWAELALKFPC